MHRLAVRARDGETRRGANASRARAMFVRLSAAAPAGRPAAIDMRVDGKIAIDGRLR